MALEGVERATFSCLLKQGEVLYCNEDVKAKDILERIRSLGFEASLPRAHSNDLINDVREEVREMKVQLICTLVLILPVLFLVWILPYAPGLKEFQTQYALSNGVTLYIFLIALPASILQIFIARPFYASAIRALKRKRLNIYFLASMATTLAYGYGVLQLIIGYSSWDTEEDHLHSVEEHAHHFETNSMLITVIVIGNMIEAYSELKTL